MNQTPAVTQSEASFVTKFIVLALVTLPAILVGSAVFVVLIVLGDFSSFGSGLAGTELSRLAVVAAGTTLLVAYYGIAATFGAVLVALPVGYLLLRGLRIPKWLGSTLLVIISIVMAVLALLVTSGVVSLLGAEPLAPGVLDKSPEFWTFAVVAGAVCGLVFYSLARSIKFLRD